jgi:hypothetical protein
MLESRRELHVRRLAQRTRSLRFSPIFQRLEDRPLLSTIVWNNALSPNGGSWDTGANWVGGVTPGTNDDAVINLSASGTVTLNKGVTDSVNSLMTNASTSISIGGDTLSLATTSAVGGNLTLTSGILTGAGTLTTSGMTTWSGGTMAGAGTTVASGGLAIGGIGDAVYNEGLSTRTLDNFGTATLSINPIDGGSLGFSNGATLNNESGASFAFNADTSVTTSNGGGSINNAGTLSKSGGTGTSTISAVLNDTGAGAVQVQSGTLALAGGGSLAGTGSLSASAGTTLAFANGTFTVASTAPVSGAGTVTFTGATVHDAGPYDVTGITSVTASAATVTLSGSLQSLGTALSVSAGTLNLTGAIPGGAYSFTGLSIGGTLNFSTGASIAAGQLTITAGILTGSDTVTVSGMTTWSGGTMSGAGTTVANSGLMLGGTGSANYSETLSARTLSNFGTATLTDNSVFGGGIAFTNGSTFNNEAAASFAIAGDLSISVSNGGGTFSNAGTLTKSGGTSTSTISVVLNDTGAGSVQVQSGTLALAGGGTLAGTGSLSASAGTTLAFANGTFTVASTAPVSGGGTVTFTGATVHDAGPYDVTGITSVTASAATVTLSGSLQSLGTALTVSAGTLNLTGTIPGGAYSFTGLSIGGTLNFSTGASIAVGQLTITGGILTGSDTVTVSGLTTWSGGTMSGTGTTVANGGLTLGGTGNASYSETLSARTLNNFGTATFNSNPSFTGGIAFTNGSTLNNEAAASFTIAADLSIDAANGGGTFNNAGTLTKSGGTGTSTISALLNDTGVGSVQAQSGTLALAGGGTLGGTGALSVSTGATLGFANGTFAVASTAPIAGAGAVIFSGATVSDPGLYDVTGTTSVTSGASTVTLSGNLESLGTTLSVFAGKLNLTGTIPGGAVTITAVSIGGTLNLSTGASIAAGQLAISGGTLTGPDTVTISGMTTWSGGTMSGSGTTIANGGLAIGGTAGSSFNESLTSRTLDNFGAATLANNPSFGGGLGFTSGATFNNEVGASFTINSDVSIAVGTSGTFNNAGTLAKAGGTGTSAVSVALSNYGSIQAASGTLSLQGTLSNFSSTTTTLTGGSYVITSILQIANANIVTNAASISLSAATSQFTDTTGHNALRNLATNTAAGILTFQGGATVATPGPFSNAGSLTVGAGSTFTCTGPYTQSGGSTNLVGGGILSSTTNSVAINAGVLGGTGTVNGNVSNAGQVVPGGVVGAGTLNISGNYTQSPAASMSVSLNGPTSDSGFGQLSVSGLATLAGTLYISPIGNTLPNSQAAYQVLNYGSDSGQFTTVTPQNFPSGWTFTTSYNPTNLVLTTMIPITLVSIAVTPAQASVAAGLTQQFIATGTYSDSSTENVTDQVTWTSSIAATATVSNASGSHGLASTLEIGTVSITAALGVVSGSATLNVTQHVLESIAVTPFNPSVHLGNSEQFTATGTYSDDSTANLTGQVNWTSSSTTTATISNVSGSQGLATTVAQGSTTITATLGSVTFSTPMVVTAPALVSIAVTPSNPSFPEGSTHPLDATSTFTDGSTQDLTSQVTWASSNQTFATITNQGIVSALELGSTNITAIDGSVSASTILTVVTPMVDFTVLGQALSGDLTTILSNVNGVFKIAEAIPVIGQNLFNNTAISADFSTLNDLTAALGTIPTQTVNGANLTASIQNALFSALGPAGDGILADINDLNGGTIEADDILVTPGADVLGSLDINLLLTKTETTALGFSLGLGNFLSMKSAPDAITLSVTTDYLLDLSYDPVSGTLTLNNTSLATQNDALGTTNLPTGPLAFVLSATPSSSTLGSGQLAGIMQATVTDKGTGLTAVLGVGLDSSLAPTVTLSGSASVDVNLSLDFGSNIPLNPTITTGLSFQLNFDNSSLDPTDPTDFGTFSAPITFNGVNVSLQLGVIGTIIADIQDVTEPLQPIINILNANIPGLDSLGIDVSLINLLVGATGGDTSAVDTFFNDITLINSLHISTDSTISVPVLSSVQITDPRAGAPSTTSDTTETNDPATQFDNADSDLTALDTGDNPLFSFPIFSDPADTVIPLLLGTAATAPPDLFTFHLSLPTISTGISIPVGSIPPFIPVLLLDIGVGLGLSVGGGYDTAGLIKIATSTTTLSADDIASDIADGFYIDDAETYIKLMGSIGLEADAYIVSITGGLSLDLELQFSDALGTNGKTRLDTLINKFSTLSLGDLFQLSGEIDLGFTINVGLELGFVHVTLFSVNIGPFVIVSFGPPSPQPLSSPPTIFINETNTNESIHVQQMTYPDPTVPGQTDSAIEVVYPTYNEIYPTGATNANGPVVPDPFPQYSQIVTRVVPTPLVTPLGTFYEQEPIVEPQSITIGPDVTSDNLQDQPTPVNAILIGGQGSDDLEYDASGQAVLIGAGGNNTLSAGGKAASVIDYGNTIDPAVASPLSPLSGPNVPAWVSALPATIQQEIAAEVSTPTDTTTSDTFAGTGGLDFFEGGAGSNNFQETGNNFTLMALGQVANIVEYTTPTGTAPGTSNPGKIYFGDNPNTENIIGLQLVGTNNLTLMPVVDAAGNYLQIAGTQTNLDAYGDTQNVSVALDGGTLEVGDLSLLPSITSMFVTEDNGTTPPKVPASGANTIIFDAPVSGAASTLDLGSIQSNEVDVVSEPGLIPPSFIAPPSYYDVEAQEAATNDNVIIQGLTSADTVRFNIDGGTVNVSNVDQLGAQSLVIDGSGRAVSANPLGIAVNVTGPYEAGPGDPNYNIFGIPDNTTMSVLTDASGDPEIKSGPYYGISGQLSLHGSIPADSINLNIPVELSSWGGGFAQPPSAFGLVSVDASAFKGTLIVSAVPAQFTIDASGPWFFTAIDVNISAVNASGNVVVTGLDHNDFPYPYAIDSGNTGQTYVTVGAGLLSQIQGSVTVSNAQLTVNNSQSTDTDILTMTAASLSGWTVPTGVAPPSIFWSPILYNTLLVKAGNDENIDVEGMPTLQALTLIGTIYSTFDGNYSVTFQNRATSAAPDSIYVVATNPTDILSVDGDYSLYVGRRLNPDGSVTNLGTASQDTSPIVFDYSGTGGNANLVFDASKDTQRIYGQIATYSDPYIVAPAGELSLDGVFTTFVYGGILFNPSKINITFDSDICPGSTNNGGDTLYLSNPGTDTVTYNATTVPGGTQIANDVIIETSGAQITVNGNGNTQVSFQQDLSNDFNLYTGIAADVDVNDADIDVTENSESYNLPDLSNVVLTGNSFSGATIGTINFTALTGFSYEETSPAVSGITMTVENTPAGITSSLTISGTNLTILATTGPLDVLGYEGEPPESFVTVGDGSLAGIVGALVIKSNSSGVNGFATTIDGRLDGPHGNVVITVAAGVAETITGLAPASVGFDGGGFLNLYGSAGSTYTVVDSVGPFNLYAGAGSTVNLESGTPYQVKDLTVIGGSVVNVGQGDLSHFSDDTIEDDPNQPNDLIAVTVNATADNGTWSFLLADGPSGFDSLEFDRANAGEQTLNLQQSTVQLTLELPTSGTTSPGLTVDDTGLQATTIDEGNVPTTVAGTTGPLLLQSNNPTTIVIGGSGTVQSLNGAVDVETLNPGQTAASLIVDDSADTTARSIMLAPATGGLNSITGLAPAPIDFTAAAYKLTLKAGTGNNDLVVADTSAGAGLTVNTGPGNNTASAYVSGTGGFAPLTVNGGAGHDSLFVAGSGDNPVVTNVPAAGQTGAGQVQASYPPAGPTRIINYTGINTIGGVTAPVLVATATVVTPGSSSVSAGQSVTVTASVASASGPPTDGTVQFLVDGADFGSPVSLAGGLAQILITEPVGMFTIAAQYSGDDLNFAASPVSAAANLVVYAPVTVSSFTGVLSPTNMPQANIDVTFNAPIQTGSLIAGALTLTDDNSSKLVGAGISLKLVSGTTSTYAINGLSSLTADQGEYTLTFNAVDVTGQNGFSGTGARSVSWLMDTTAPTSDVVNSLGTSQTSDTFSVPVTFGDPGGAGGAAASGVATVELFVSVNNGKFASTPSQTITLTTPESAGKVTFNFNGQDRNTYAFYSIAIDAAGNTESSTNKSIEASTSVPDLNPPVTQVLASSTYASGVFTLNWSGTDPDWKTGTPAGTIALVNFYVVINNEAPQEIGQSPGGTPNAQGVYSGTLLYNGLADGQAHTYSFYSIGVDDEGKTQAVPASDNVTFSDSTFNAPLAVSSFDIEKTIAERSFIQYLDVNFNQEVATSSALQTLASGLAGGAPSSYVELLYYGENVTASTIPTGVPLFNTGSSAVISLAGNDLSLNFGPNGMTSLLAGSSGALSPTKTFGDGWYLLGIDPTGNASNDQEFWEPFFRLLGDTNGDGVVTGPYSTAGTDAYTVYHAEGQSGSFLNADVNGDGAVNSKDLAETVAAKGDAVGAGPVPGQYPAFQLLAGVAGPGGTVAITQTEVQALLPAAIAAWEAAGLDAANARRLERVTIKVGNLGANILAIEAADVITIDQTAAGDDWFVESGRPSADRVDLLTVLEHELGHVLGLSDNEQPGDILDTTLGQGERRSPTRADVAAVDAVLPALVSEHVGPFLRVASRRQKPVIQASKPRVIPVSRFAATRHRPGQP